MNTRPKPISVLQYKTGKNDANKNVNIIREQKNNNAQKQLEDLLKSRHVQKNKLNSYATVSDMRIFDGNNNTSKKYDQIQKTYDEQVQKAYERDLNYADSVQDDNPYEGEISRVDPARNDYDQAAGHYEPAITYEPPQTNYGPATNRCEHTNRCEPISRNESAVTYEPPQVNYEPVANRCEHANRCEPTLSLNRGEPTLSLNRGEPTLSLNRGEPTLSLNRGEPNRCDPSRAYADRDAQQRHDSNSNHCGIPLPNQNCPKISPNKQCIRSYSNTWESYWPYNGTGITDPGLLFQLNYATFNNTLIEKWKINLPTPQTTSFPTKKLFDFHMITDAHCFDFNYRFENLPLDGQSPIIINVNPNSNSTPFNPNQFIFIKDPAIDVQNPGTSTTNILAVIAHYKTNELYLNQFTNSVDSLDLTSNLFISTQLFVMHINQIKDRVELTVSHTSNIGENLFEVTIETNTKVEIKETIIPVAINPVAAGDEVWYITILQRTIYINGKYFMTYAVYDNDVHRAIELGDISKGYTTDARQVPIQLATMLLFGPSAPIVDLGSVSASTEQERMLIQLFNNFLKKNV